MPLPGCRHARIVWTLLALLLSSSGVSGALAQGSAPPKLPSVVFLHSYDPAYPWTFNQERGVREALAELRPPIIFRVENLDARRETRPAIRDRLAAILAAKYGDSPPRLVVATDDAAVEFLLAHPEVFPEVPVVFGGVNNVDLAARLRGTRFTGVTEPNNARSFVTRMLSLRPGTRRVFIVAESAGLTSELSTDVGAIAPTLDIVALPSEAMGINQMLTRLAAETRADDLVFLRPVWSDANGSVEGDLSTRDIAQASKAPVVSPNLSDLGQGILAGVGSQGQHHGRLVGAKALAVLRGSPVTQIPIEPAIDDQLVFDAQQLRRWGLSEQELPPGSLVVNQPPSFYRANKVLIWSGLVALVVQSGIIGALVVVARSRRRALQAVEKHAGELALSMGQLDLTNRSLVQAQAGREAAEEALRQSQKMEALGRLAGSVAHDFNNLLTVIIGQSLVISDQLPVNSDARVHASEIRAAGQQAATLTRQLLAFSRKQVVPMAWCDVSATIQHLEPIVRRLMPAPVEVVLLLADDLPTLMIGEGQFEQMILNLVTNARDAMPEGGRLTVQTTREMVEASESGNEGLVPGRYLVLRVTDTGVGMDEATQRQAFEPFFTTKAPGSGTGVGLSTVYGIVTQHRGKITVETAPGRGSSFAVYLPMPATDVCPSSATTNTPPVTECRVKTGAGER